MDRAILASICNLGCRDFEAAKVTLACEMEGCDVSSLAAIAAKLISEQVDQGDFGAVACLIYLMAVSGWEDAAVLIGQQALGADVDDERVIIALADALHRQKIGGVEFFDVLCRFYHDQRSVYYKKKLSDYSHDAGYAFMSEHYMRGWIASGDREFIPILADFWGVTRDWASVSNLLKSVECASEWGNSTVYLYGRSAVSHFDEDGVVRAIKHLAISDGGLAELLGDVWRWRIGTPLAKRAWSMASPSRVAQRDLAKLAEINQDNYRSETRVCSAWRLTGTRTSTVEALLIGTQRAGTSWLWSMLMESPDVHRIGFKEPVFFSDPFTDIGGVPEELLLGAFDETDRKYWDGPTRSLFNYTRLFTSESRIRIDASPTYAELPDMAVERASDIVGRQTKIILLVRDPVERAWSNFCYDIMATNRTPTSFDFEQRIAHYRSAASIRRGRYAEIIERWSAHFDDVRAFIFDEIIECPTKILREICSFLNIQNVVDTEDRQAVNRSGDHIMPREDRSFLLGLYANEYDRLAPHLGERAVKWQDRHLSVLAR